MAKDNKSFRDPDQQKRDTARIRVNIEATYRYKSQNEWLPCTILDLGVGGLAIKGKMSFYEGDHIEIKFALEGQNVIAIAEITNIAGRKAGGRFTEISEKSETAIHNYLNRIIFSQAENIEFK